MGAVPVATAPSAAGSAAPSPVVEVPAVTAALAALDGVAQRPLEEHVEVFDTVHRLLQDALAGLDER